MQETGINWMAMPRPGRLEAIMKTEVAMRMVVAHNEHENLGRRQWGGMGIVAYGDLEVSFAEWRRTRQAWAGGAWYNVKGGTNILYAS